MAGRIPEQFVEECLARADIAEVIGGRLELRRQGADFRAICPFHNDTRPSLNVNSSRQIYKCFVCEAGGDALKFLMEYDGIPFPEAVEKLASMVGLEMPAETRDPQAAVRAPMYELLQRCSAWFQKQLQAHPGAQSYLQRRGLSRQVADEYGLGFVPEGWNNLMNAGIAPPPTLLQAGMLVDKEGKRSYDRFRNRIMFPIRDNRGRVVGFGGRVMDDTEPKYLNSPETPVFSKGRELYGLFEARQAQRNPAEVLLVEGYMDVIGLADEGIHNAVATLGTATSEAHLTRLFRWVDHLVFCFDGDRAGRQAAVRGMDVAIPALQDGRQLSFLFLPDGEDPDSLVRSEGPDAFRSRIAGAEPLSEFLFEEAALNTDLTRVEGRARFAKNARDRIRHLPEGAFREQMFERVQQLIRAPRPAGSSAQPVHGRHSRVQPRRRQPEEELLAIGMNRPDLMRQVVEADWRQLRSSASLECHTLAHLISLARRNQSEPAEELLLHLDAGDPGLHCAERILARPLLLQDPREQAREFAALLQTMVRRAAAIPEELEQRVKAGNASADDLRTYQQLIVARRNRE